MPDHIYSIIGLAIRSRREAIGMTQATLAERTSLSRTSITNIERGGQALLVHQLLELAKVLRISPTSLLPNVKLTGEAEEQSRIPDAMKTLIDRLENSGARKRRR